MVFENEIEWRSNFAVENEKRTVKNEKYLSF
jgi:hypothetical protein